MGLMTWWLKRKVKQHERMKAKIQELQLCRQAAIIYKYPQKTIDKFDKRIKKLQKKLWIR